MHLPVRTGFEGMLPRCQWSSVEGLRDDAGFDGLRDDELGCNVGFFGAPGLFEALRKCAMGCDFGFFDAPALFEQRCD